ncbi:hypothetical protein [Pseudazoarcus pumilus]|uniref:DUF2730 domain-containing protein n=1 Tax=Pseudazoarcus pumilus TaxID=2067960 RepID=A0A2I6S9G9_9RHOO|nr:hypothetical protein [Pseudazoarcus pumilus]AUN95889.1 hypothetical protein C0099_13685 [Pseudazoarcus pumilus]
MTVEEKMFWLQVVHIVVTFGIGIYVWATGRHRVTNERISDLEEAVDHRLDTHSERLVRLETQIKAAPTHHDLGALYAKQNETSRAVSQLVGEVKGMGETLRLILNRIAEKGMK